jgi:hypothetical protein
VPDFVIRRWELDPYPGDQVDRVSLTPTSGTKSRIRASSFVRCATMIEKVLRIRNTPTNRATPANPSRTLLKNARPERKLPTVSSYNCLPVFTAYVSPTAARTASRNLVGLVPGAACTSMDE